MGARGARGEESSWRGLLGKNGLGQEGWFYSELRTEEGTGVGDDRRG